MSKEYRHRCPDCLGLDYFAIPERGNGICKHCQGEGQIPELVDMFTALVDADSIHICPECSGTKQCQTCGGTGFEYYNVYDDDDSYEEAEDSYNDSNDSYSSYSPDYSSDSGYYSSSNESYTSPVSYRSNNDVKERSHDARIFIWLFIIGCLVVLLYFYNKTTKQPTVPIQSSISEINKTGYISANNIANIRNGPSTNNTIVTKKNKGESVFVLGKDLETGWYKVKYNDFGNVGYISNNLISFNPIKTKELETNSETTSREFSSESSNGNSNKQNLEVQQNKSLENPYGNGNGQLTIYNKCSNGSAIKVLIDKNYLGIFK